MTWGHRSVGAPDYTIDPAFISRASAVVDWALGRDLYVFPVSGGEPRLVAQDVMQFAWAPDGSALALVRFISYPVPTATPAATHRRRRSVAASAITDRSVASLSAARRASTSPAR